MITINSEWNSRPILNEDDKDDLDTRSAIHMFHHNLPRHEADEKAYQDYKRDKLIEGAAHHLRGLTSSHSIGDKKTAAKHGIIFKKILQELKHDDHLNPPKEVMEKFKNNSESFHQFRAHPADYYLISKENNKEVKED